MNAGFNYLAGGLPKFAKVALRRASLNFGPKGLGCEKTESPGVMTEVGIEAVDERLALPASQDPEVLQTHQLVETGSKSLVRPAEKLSELTSGPVDRRRSEIRIVGSSFFILFSTRVHQFSPPSTQLVQRDPENSQRQLVGDSVVLDRGLDERNFSTVHDGRSSLSLKLM